MLMPSLTVDTANRLVLTLQSLYTLPTSHNLILLPTSSRLVSYTPIGVPAGRLQRGLLARSPKDVMCPLSLIRRSPPFPHLRRGPRSRENLSSSLLHFSVPFAVRQHRHLRLTNLLNQAIAHNNMWLHLGSQNLDFQTSTL